MKSNRYLAALLVLVLITAQPALGTALDDYVAAPDANYSYTLVNTIKAAGYTAYVLNMTSQKWRSSTEVDRTLWQHWLTIIKPDRVAANVALLWITGGSNRRSAPDSPADELVTIALDTNTVVAELRMVPNQPLTFAAETNPRSEDEIIAYTFDKFLTTGDANWPALLPMVKSAVRAMDTVQSYLSSVTKAAVDIDRFVVSGASKRGWTTWLTAAVDSRVVAIVPVVIDLLNIDEQMRHHYNAYGFYSDAIHDYEEMKIFDRLDTPEGQALIKFVDPYEYRSRYTMPKYLINSTGDQFFLPDSAAFYFQHLTGDKYLRYIPNTDHSLAGSDAYASLLVFYKSVLADQPRPKFSWQLKDNSLIVKNISAKLIEVNLWQATNPKARDFRLQTIGRTWTSSPLRQQDTGVYIAKVPQPQKGWTAFFVELIFDSGGKVPYKFTTQIRVLPQRLPFAPNPGL